MATTISNYVLNRMRKELRRELEVAVCAEDVWEVYSSPDLPKLILKLLPGVFENIEIVEGDGGVGTVLKLTFPPATTELNSTIANMVQLELARLMKGKFAETGYINFAQLGEFAGSVPVAYKETYVMMDHHKCLLDAKQIEGGYLDMGCTFYMVRFQIIKKDHNSCVIVSRIEYEVPNEEIASQVEPFISIDSLSRLAKAISNYIQENKKA